MECRRDENHGTVYATRFKLLRERILAMKALWTEEEAQFHGEMVNFDPVWFYPKPYRKPHPPILLGGESDITLRRIAEFCDGCSPRANAAFVADEAVARLHRAAANAGRDPATLSITVFRAPADAAGLDTYRDAGIDRALLEIPDLSRDEILRHLDTIAPLAAYNTGA